MSSYENGLDNYIESRLMSLARKGQCYTFRNNSFSGRIQRYDGSSGFIRNANKGTPDRVVLLNGLFWGLELKTQKGIQSTEQKAVQKQMQSAGGKYSIIRTVEDFEAALKELL